MNPVPQRGPSTFTLEGELFRRQNDDSGMVSLLMAPYVLEFHGDDVQDIEELPPPPGLRIDRAISARVTLRSGARLRNMSDGRQAEALIFDKRAPFSIRAREGAPCEIRQDRFQRMEAAFLAAGELDPQQSD